MGVRRHIGFGSTPNWSNIYKQIKHQCEWSRYVASSYWDDSATDEDIAHAYTLLNKEPLKMPTLTFKGSEKLHGENMAVCYSQEELWVQGQYGRLV